jgi:hypothetical protein
VDVTPAIQGALLAGPDGPRSVTWMQGLFKMIVIGPQQSFHSDTATALATETAKSFAP